MNAYELADELENKERLWSIEEQLMINVCHVLRQQADRIAELEKEVKRLVGAEPITHGKLTFCKNCGQQDPYAQTKPLSNDEILEMTIWNKNLYELYVEMEKEDMIAFARAIEERHGIK